jgi:CheY-like chemotaxis protein
MEEFRPHVTDGTPHPSTPSRGTILIADDEDVVLEFLSDVFACEGYEVFTAADGCEAADVLRRYGSKLSAAILDISMPGKSGVEVASLVAAENPRIPVVLMSGYSESDIRERFPGVQMQGYLQKPYNPDRLVQLVDQVLPH